MRISSISIKNFRLLEDITVELEDDITLIVGRNNTGKSSMADLCVDFLEKQNELRFVDFSKSCYEKFNEAYGAYQAYENAKSTKASDEEIVALKTVLEHTLPKITLEILIEYDKVKDTDLTGLSAFIMDLDEKRTDALILFEFSANDAVQVFTKYEKEKAVSGAEFLSFLDKNINFLYSLKLYAVDNKKREYRRLIENSKKAAIEKVFLTRSITAQRGVDDNSKDNKRTLGKGFERYYKHTKPNDDKSKIEASLKELSEQLEGNYKELFKNILTGLTDFGGTTPTIIPEITIKSIFQSEEVLSDNIRYFYSNGDNVLLPENYNGLGYSNLIYMVLQFASFFEEFKNIEPKSEFLFIILEEPEAHMHPQMQQVFIKNVRRFLENNGSCAQLVITTHSSHILAESGITDKKGFDRIRYFDKSADSVKVKDLSTLKIDDEDDGVTTKKFLRQYLTLHKCDLLFADKVILVEGPTERMILPQIIGASYPSLHSEYITILEVGGAYAHRFKELLEFINVKTLIITDLDSIDPANKRTACKVEKGKGLKTSNQVLKQWLPAKEEIDDLLGLDFSLKISGCERMRVTYQISENDKTPCGRSLEEALILKNAAVFSKNGKLLVLKEYFDKSADDIIKDSYDLTAKILKDLKKTDFAFDLLLEKTWESPLYIAEGLNWLEENDSKEVMERVLDGADLMGVAASEEKTA